MTQEAKYGDSTGWAMRRTLGGLDVPDVDVARLEGAYLERKGALALGTTNRAAGRRQRLVVMALSAVTALAVSVASLVIARAATTTSDQTSPPASAATTLLAPGALADLAGLWRVEAEDAWPTLWILAADGSFEVLRPADLTIGPTERGSVVPVASDRLAITDRAGCRAQFRLERLGVDRLTAYWLTTDATCQGDLGPDRDWPTSLLTRVAPTTATVSSTYFTSTPEPVRWDSALKGTWLLQGANRVLVIDRERYVVLDDVMSLAASGHRVWEEQGTVRIAAKGKVEFLPRAKDARPDCSRVYRVRADYATLDARLDQESCGRLGSFADTWIRLS